MKNKGQRYTLLAKLLENTYLFHLFWQIFPEEASITTVMTAG